MIVRKFKLALNAGKSIPLVIHANQYDHDEQWEFTLYNDDGTQYIPSSGAIVGIKSDNLGIINSGTVSGGVVIINETEQMTAAPGKAVFELMIDSQTHGTANFIVLVEPKPGDNASLSESDLSLLQEAIDSTSPAAIAEGVSNWMDENLTPTTPVVDASLTVSGAAADAKATGDRITALENRGGLTADIKEALLACFEKVAWKGTDGQDYYDALESALYPPANLSYITAVYTQSGTVYTTDSLDSLKNDLIVTAHYDNGTPETVTNYTLSGTLTVGTSTITVTYGGKTATFNVTVTANVVSGAYAIWDARDYTVGQTWSDRIGGIALTPAGSPTKADGAVVFDGTAKYFSVGQLAVPTAPGVVTIQCAFKLTDLTKSSFIFVDNISTGSKFVFALRPQDGVIRIQCISGTNVTFNYQYTFDTNWHLLTAKLGDGNKYVYIDETLIDNITDTRNVNIANSINSATDLDMGAYPVYNGYSYMHLRSLYIYPKSLSDADITTNYSIESSLWG